MKALVTGSTGGLGRAVCRQLEKLGYDVVAMTRSRPADRLSQRDPVVCDIGSVDWERHLGDTNVVFHCAALVHRPSGTAAEEYKKINEVATIRLAQACNRMEVRLVFASSIAVLQPETSGPNWYARSKRAAEEALANMTGLNWTSLRFPLLYGPYGRGNLERMLFAILRRRFWPISSSSKKSILYFDDAAQAMTLALGSDCNRRILEVGPLHPPTLEQINRAAYRACARGYPPPIPAAYATQCAMTLDKVAGVLGRRLAINDRVQALIRDTATDCHEFRRLTHFEETTSLNEGFDFTVKCILDSGRMT